MCKVINDLCILLLKINFEGKLQETCLNDYLQSSFTLLLKNETKILVYEQFLGFRWPKFVEEQYFIVILCFFDKAMGTSNSYLSMLYDLFNASVSCTIHSASRNDQNYLKIEVGATMRPHQSVCPSVTLLLPPLVNRIKLRIFHQSFGSK